MLLVLWVRRSERAWVGLLTSVLGAVHIGEAEGPTEAGLCIAAVIVLVLCDHSGVG